MSSFSGIYVPPLSFSLPLSVFLLRLDFLESGSTTRVTDADSLLGLGVVSLSFLSCCRCLCFCFFLSFRSPDSPLSPSPPSLPHQTDAPHTTLIAHKGSSQGPSVYAEHFDAGVCETDDEPRFVKGEGEDGGRDVVVRVGFGGGDVGSRGGQDGGDDLGTEEFSTVPPVEACVEVSWNENENFNDGL